MRILSADAGQQIDGVSGCIYDCLPSGNDGITVCPVSYYPNYRFNEELREVGRYVLVDFLEMGWDWQGQDNRIGTGSLRNYGHLNSDEYAKLEAFVAEHPPLVTFKRELLREHVTDRMKPIGFPCLQPILPTQSSEEFDARPIEVLFNWGLSHNSRQRLHGEIFTHAHDYGLNVIDNWQDLDHLGGRSWVSIYTPWWRRKHIDEIMQWQRQSKVSVSLPGAGINCFRSGEACNGSIMALWKDQIAWAFPWTHGENCIRLSPEFEIDDLLELDFSNLYDIYRQGQLNAECYRPASLARYMTQIIQSL